MREADGKGQVFDDLSDMLGLVLEDVHVDVCGTVGFQHLHRVKGGPAKQWERVRRPHGCGTTNDAGKVLLTALQPIGPLHATPGLRKTST